jgi:DNA (cytosine-5)-methyltransferase 1
MRVVLGVDVDAHAGRTFKKNFPAAEFLQGSVRSTVVIGRCLELLDPLQRAGHPFVLLSGPPCQGFSAAGSRDPADPRNQVLMAVARAIASLKPDCALVENVSMVLADAHNKRLGEFKQKLADAGYKVQCLVLDAVHFGVAQKRRRAFFLISKQLLDAQRIQTRFDQLKQAECSVKAALSGLPRPLVRPDDYDDERDYGIFSNHLAMQHSERVIKKIARLKPGTGPMSYRKLHPAKPAKTLFSGHRAPPAHHRDPRSITVREAARLQGFPDSFRVYGSFGSQMQQVTNSVPPPLAKVVLTVLSEFIGLPLYA